jgi:ubiquinone/menaquinone biosynthesis C-methylase UbiE
METTLKYRSKIVIEAIRPILFKDKRVLDIGCGNGVVSQEISAHFGCDIVGTDILAYLKKKIPFKLMNKPDVLDFHDQAFDVGLLIDVLHHIPFDRQAALIQEARRVCRVVLLFEVKPTLVAKAVDYFINQIHHPAMPLPLTHRSQEEWMQLFDANNIPAQCFPVKKPAFFYPSTNYLFALHGSSK